MLDVVYGTLSDALT